jgi:hypothetical protein
MSQLIQALTHLPEMRLPHLPLPGGEDRDKWVPVVCAAGFCILTLADWFVR